MACAGQGRTACIVADESWRGILDVWSCIYIGTAGAGYVYAIGVIPDASRSEKWVYLKEEPSGIQWFLLDCSLLSQLSPKLPNQRRKWTSRVIRFSLLWVMCNETSWRYFLGQGSGDEISKRTEYYRDNEPRDIDETAKNQNQSERECMCWCDMIVYMCVCTQHYTPRNTTWKL